MSDDIRRIRDTRDLADAIRAHRRAQGATQGELAGIAAVGKRFVSEVENGKETAEIGRVLRLLHRLGLDLWVTPRGVVPARRDEGQG